MPLPTSTLLHELTIEIGGMPILVRTDDAAFAEMTAGRYGEFVAAGALDPVAELDIDLVKEPGPLAGDSGNAIDGDADVSVRKEGDRWIVERGDFRAEWDQERRRGWVRQSANPYALDGVLRILHSLILARAGGFLVHAASAVRNGRAFIFAGVSGAGKTTLARLAPPDVILLTDEISYVRGAGDGTGDSGRAPSKLGLPHMSPQPGMHRRRLDPSPTALRSPLSPWRGKKVKTFALSLGERGDRKAVGEGSRSDPTTLTGPWDSGAGFDAKPELRAPSPVSRLQGFHAFGTPFAGELARLGEKIQAPVAGLFLLDQGPENRIEPLPAADAARDLLRHVLFFAHDEELVRLVFLSVCDFVKRVPVRRLTFMPDARVWELIA